MQRLRLAVAFFASGRAGGARDSRAIMRTLHEDAYGAMRCRPYRRGRGAGASSSAGAATGAAAAASGATASSVAGDWLREAAFFFSGFCCSARFQDAWASS